MTTYPVSFNGKVLAKVELPSDISIEDIKLSVAFCEPVKGLLEGKKVKKVIVVKDRIINFVIEPS